MKLDRFNKETKVEENRQAIKLLREADIFVEAQFIAGLDNETEDTLEETYRMAWDWQPNLANPAMYTAWPFTLLFEEIKDQVEIGQGSGETQIRIVNIRLSARALQFRIIDVIRPIAPSSAAAAIMDVRGSA